MLASLVAQIKVKADTQKVKGFSNALKNLTSVAFTATGLMAGLGAAIANVNKDAFASSTSFKQFEIETGASAQTLQKWQSVAEQTGQSADSVTNSVKSLADNLAKIRRGEGNPQAFNVLGIDPNQNPFAILEQFKAATANLSASARKDWASMMGIDSGLLQTLELSSEQFNQMSSHGFLISDGAIESLNSAKGSLNLAGRAVKWLKSEIAVGLAPEIKGLSSQFVNFIKLNRDGFVKGFKTALDILSKFFGALNNAGKMLDQMIKSTIGWKNALIGFGVALAAMSIPLLASPLGLLVAGFAALALVLDDLYVYSKGGDSVFGALEETSPKLFGFFQGLFNVISNVFTRLGEAFDLVTAFAQGDEAKIDSILDSWGTFGDFIQNIIDLIEILQGSLTKIDKEATFEGSITGSQAKLAQENPWGNAPKWFQEVMNFGLPTAPSAYATAQAGIPMDPSMIPRGSTTQTQNFTTNVTFTGSPNSTEVENGVTEAIKDAAIQLRAKSGGF